MTTTHAVEVAASHHQQDTQLSRRIDGIGWGLLLIMTGAIWLIPDQQVPQGTWLIGTGALLLTLNGIRYLKGIGAHGLVTFLGAVALAAGLGEYFGLRLPLLAICFIVIGGGIILKPLIVRTRSEA